MSNNDQKRCGFVAVIGLPNAGKSTLVNALVGDKVSIVSRKVQTTRSRITGIVNRGETQIVLLDTPGIFTPKKTLERAMVKAALDTLDADVVLHLVDAATPDPFDYNEPLIEKLPKHGRPCVLVLNKVDKVAKEKLLALTAAFTNAYDYTAVFMISALKKRGLEDVLDFCIPHLPHGPWHYDEDQITDMPAGLLASEITREKIFERLHQELPYSIMVATENWENFDNGSIKIDQIVYVQKDSQKGIVLGRQGSQIKAIGEAARRDLEEILEARVHLKLFVKVQENWSERPENYRFIGLEF